MDVRSDKEKQEYVNKLNESHCFDQSCPGLMLNVSDIQDSKADQGYFKMVQNSFSGKWSQSNVRPRLVYVNSFEEICDFFHSESEKIIDMDLLNEATMQLTLKPNKESVKINRSANVIIGSMITSVARCHIYKAKQALDSVGFKTHYIDCDSIIYSKPVGNSNTPLPEGFCYGDFREEVPNGSIESFSSLGVKSYNVLYRDKDTGKMISEMKISGLSLKSVSVYGILNSSVYNHAVESFLNEIAFKVNVPQQRRKTKKDLTCTKLTLRKTLFSNNVFKKRILMTNVSKKRFTKPYGYISSMKMLKKCQ